MGKKLMVLMTFLWVALGLAAQVTVTGTVVDKEENEPLPGVTVKLKGKGNVADRKSVV